MPIEDVKVKETVKKTKVKLTPMQREIENSMEYIPRGERVQLDIPQTLTKEQQIFLKLASKDWSDALRVGWVALNSKSE